MPGELIRRARLVGCVGAAIAFFIWSPFSVGFFKSLVAVATGFLVCASLCLILEAIYDTDAWQQNGEESRAKRIKEELDPAKQSQFSQGVEVVFCIAVLLFAVVGGILQILSCAGIIHFSD